MNTGPSLTAGCKLKTFIVFLLVFIWLYFCWFCPHTHDFLLFRVVNHEVRVFGQSWEKNGECYPSVPVLKEINFLFDAPEQNEKIQIIVNEYIVTTTEAQVKERRLLCSSKYQIYRCIVEERFQMEFSLRNAKGELIEEITYVKVDNVNRSYWHYW